MGGQYIFGVCLYTKLETLWICWQRNVRIRIVKILTFQYNNIIPD